MKWKDTKIFEHLFYLFSFVQILNKNQENYQVLIFSIEKYIKLIKFSIKYFIQHILRQQDKRSPRQEVEFRRNHKSE